MILFKLFKLFKRIVKNPLLARRKNRLIEIPLKLGNERRLINNAGYLRHVNFRNDISQRGIAVGIFERRNEIEVIDLLVIQSVFRTAEY